MPLTPGLSPNIRLPQQGAMVDVDEPDVEVMAGDVPDIGDDDRPDVDERGNVLRIEHGDGSVTVSIDGKPIGRLTDEEASPGWFDNLAEKIDENELSRITDTLLRGIEDDINSRTEWIDDRAQGLSLLGLKIEMPGVQGAADGAPVEGMSKVRHPLLLEAVLRYQANARSEFLPTDGPVKIDISSNNGSTELDDLANAFERDMNHYLTSTASEYYPDTDRMLFMQGFGGCGFKKVYFCPLRNRPVSESIDADDLIVNQAATDLSNAKRITHRIMMRPSVVKRMQLLNAYRDITLVQPQQINVDAVKETKAQQQGINPTTTNADDRDREIYECYCELDIVGFEHKKRGTPTGLELPYRVTIDKSSRQVLSIVRNFDEGEKLPTARKVFVKFPFVPGMGFYDIGLLHILGNTTNAVTAAWRELLDAGMYSNFPGFLYADAGARQNSNLFRVPPGGGAMIKTGGMPINQAVMPLPYKEPSMALFNLATEIAEYGQRVGGTAEVAVGEGRQDAPVGTTLAVIEQATKVLNSVHKRFHAAQAEEFSLIVDCFRENPESFWQMNKRPAYKWDQETFLQALENYYLTPKADPNTSSSTQRMMKVTALMQLASAAPDLYNTQEVNKLALKTIGFTNVDELVNTGNIPPSPEQMEKVARLHLDTRKVENEEKETKADIMKASAEVMKDQAQAHMDMASQHMEAGGVAGGQDPIKSQTEMMKAKADLIDAIAHHQEIGVNARDSVMDNENSRMEREARQQDAQVDLHRDMINNHKETTLEQMRMVLNHQKDQSRLLGDAMKHQQNDKQIDHEVNMAIADQHKELQRAGINSMKVAQPKPKKKPKPGLAG